MASCLVGAKPSSGPGLLLIEPLGINFSEIFIEIQTFSLKKMHLKVSSAKWRPFCLCLNVVNKYQKLRLQVYFHVFPRKFSNPEGREWNWLNKTPKPLWLNTYIVTEQYISSFIQNMSKMNDNIFPSIHFVGSKPPYVHTGQFPRGEMWLILSWNPLQCVGPDQWQQVLFNMVSDSLYREHVILNSIPLTQFSMWVNTCIDQQVHDIQHLFVFPVKPSF